MKSNTVSTCNFINEVFKNELLDLNITLTEISHTEKGNKVSFSYEYDKIKYQSSFIYNLNDDITGWLGVCDILETLENQLENILRHELVLRSESSYKIIVNEKINEEVNKLKEVDFELNQSNICKLLNREIKPMLLVNKFKNEDAFTINYSDMFGSKCIESKTMIIVRRVIDDLVKNITLKGLYKNKRLLSLSNIINQLLSHNINDLSSLLKKYDITINRYQSDTFISVSTTSVLKIED